MSVHIHLPELTPRASRQWVARAQQHCRRLHVPVVVLSVAAMTSACDQLFGPNQAQCDHSVATVRQAISFGQFESAQQWRDYTWKVCGSTPIVEALDRELVEAKQKAEQEAIAEKKREREVAQLRINAAQRIWRKFDALPAKQRTESALAASFKSAKRQAKGVADGLAAQLTDYNQRQFAKRQAALAKR